MIQPVSCIRAAAFALLLAFATATASAAEIAEAPFGDKVSAALVNYNRASPFIGSAGVLAAGGVAEAKALGFKTIVDLRGPEEGTLEEMAEADRTGITYINIPITAKAPTDAQVAQFSAIVSDPAHRPVLVHCVTANRVGAIWALHRAAQGVPGEIAIEEGRTLGLKPGREAVVRERLGLWPREQ